MKFGTDLLQNLRKNLIDNKQVKMITKKANLIRTLKIFTFQKNEPVSLVHFLTNRCNARCSFCFIDFDDPKTFKGELTLDEIDKLTKNLGKSLLNVNLTGGEPFCEERYS